MDRETLMRIVAIVDELDWLFQHPDDELAAPELKELLHRLAKVQARIDAASSLH